MPEYESIELGGGMKPRCHPNIDILEHPAVDITCDLSKGKIPLSDASTRKIISLDFIEHIKFCDFLKLLDECKRILIKGGEFEAITPDIDKASDTWWEWNEHTYHMFAGEWIKEYPQLRHKTHWTPDLLKYILITKEWHKVTWEYYRCDYDWWKEPKFKMKAIK
jgi:predicted SAM-dependent methyltransferase